MIIQQYRITHIANPEDEPIFQWRIQIQFEPNWIARNLLLQIFSETKSLKGSCLTWEWGDGSPANYFWRLWAWNAIKRHNKNGGTTYVNSRSNRSQDE